MSAASTAARRKPDLEVIALERTDRTSYAACGIPYVVGGEIDDLETLVVRTPEEFRAKQGFDVRTRHEVMAIDTGARTLSVRDLEANEDLTIGFDQLLIGTGARPMRPPIPGIDGEGIEVVHNLADTARLVRAAEDTSRKEVVVVGGGYIGIEVAEAFWRRGAHVTVLDAAPQVMRTLDPDMAELVAGEMTANGMDVRLDVTITGFEPDAVVTPDGRIPADLIVLGMGVVPNSELAGEAGLDLGARGAIRVDRRQQTSVEGIFSAGDCAESVNRVSGERMHIALGTVANRQGRIAGINIGGGYATFPGVLGTAVTRICGLEIARTGLGEHEAAAAGFEAQASRVRSSTKAHYYPGAEPMHVKVVAEKSTGRLLGAQILGGQGSAKRIDTVAMALWNEMRVDEVIDVDLSYAPPFSPVWEGFVMAARQLA